MTAYSTNHYSGELIAPLTTREPNTDTAKRAMLIDSLTLSLVLLFALAAAGFHYDLFLKSARHRWDGIVHDRHGHYGAGLKMALALRQGNVPLFLDEVERCKVWPPVHAVLVSIVLFIGGIDHRLAVLPSLAGWVMLLVFGFLTARKMVPDRWGGNIAGCVALIFLAASPAHRAYATDTMLESLGAGLTMLVLYFFLLAKERSDSVWPWRGLAIVLTILFFEKYNYWLLALLAISAPLIMVPLRERMGFFRRLRLDWRPLVRRLLISPLAYLFLLLVATIVGITMTGPCAVYVAGYRVSLYPPNNLITVAYAILLLKVGLELYRTRRKWWPRTSVAVRSVLSWHVLPLAVSFLLPRRLGFFMWFLSPNNDETGSGLGLVDSVQFYGQAMVTDYHVGPLSALIVAVLLISACLLFRGARPGAAAVLLLAVIGMVLVTIHPNQKYRFLHSWFPVVWVAAGFGFARLMALRPLQRLGNVGVVTALVLFGFLAAAHGKHHFSAGYSSTAGHRESQSSLLDVTDRFLPRLQAARKTAFLMTLPCRSLLESAYLERYGRRDGFEAGIDNQVDSVDEIVARFQGWLQSTHADTVVLVDIPPTSQLHVEVGWDYEIYGKLPELMAGQSVFRLDRTWNFDRYGCTVTLWRR